MVMGSVSFPRKAANYLNDLQLLSGGITFKFYQNLSTTSNPRFFLVESDVSPFLFEIQMFPYFFHG